MIVFDTNVLIWCLLADAQFPESMRLIVDEAPDKIYVPSVVLWEIMLLAQKGRINIGGGDPAERLAGFIEESGFSLVSLTPQIALLSRTLAFNHEDPADRFIAATAHALDCKLATSDGKLRSLPWLKLAF